MLSLDLNIDSELLMRTVYGSEFQTNSAVNRKSQLEKSVLVNGMVDEHRDWLQATFCNLMVMVIWCRRAVDLVSQDFQLECNSLLD